MGLQQRRGRNIPKQVWNTEDARGGKCLNTSSQEASGASERTNEGVKTRRGRTKAGLRCFGLRGLLPWTLVGQKPRGAFSSSCLGPPEKQSDTRSLGRTHPAVSCWGAARVLLREASDRLGLLNTPILGPNHSQGAPRLSPLLASAHGVCIDVPLAEATLGGSSTITVNRVHGVGDFL